MTKSASEVNLSKSFPGRTTKFPIFWSWPFSRWNRKTWKYKSRNFFFFCSFSVSRARGTRFRSSYCSGRLSIRYPLACAPLTPRVRQKFYGCRSPPVLRPRLTGTKLVVKSFATVADTYSKYTETMPLHRGPQCAEQRERALSLRDGVGGGHPQYLRGMARHGFLIRPGRWDPKKAEPSPVCMYSPCIRKFDVFFFCFRLMPTLTQWIDRTAME